MMKYVLDLRVTRVERLSERHLLLVATNPMGALPDMCPGQFAQLRIDDSRETFLRRPISIHNLDREKNEVSFLVQMVGEGTSSLQKKQPGSVLNAVLPLGRGFTMPTSAAEQFLLDHGFRQVRVRMHGNLARIETEPADIPRIADPKFSQQISRYLHTLGFRYITLDLDGYSFGSMDHVEI